MSHEDLCDDAKKAIDKVFGDTSVDRVTTRISISDIIQHGELILDTLQD